MGKDLSVLDGTIEHGRHTMTVRVYYEDTDFSGIVYHANYLRFLERGRTNYLRLVGINQNELFEGKGDDESRQAFVLCSMNIEFNKPALMDDLLEIVTEVTEVKGASLVMHQKILRGEDLLVKASVKIALVSGGRPKALPKELSSLLKKQL